MNNKKLLIISSALAASLAFLFPVFAWPGILVCLIPLYYVFCTSSLSFNDGYCWGLVFFSVHSFGLFILVGQHGYGILRFMAPLFFVLYCAVYAGLWFYSAHYLKNIMSKPMSWFLATMIYFLVIDRYIFWIFATNQGNTLANPLLPLLITDAGKILVAMVGSVIVLALLVSVQMAIAHLLVQKKYSVLASICFVCCGCFAVIKQKTEDKPNWVDNVIAVYPPPNKELPLAEKMQQLTHQIRACVQKNPHASVLLFPESTISLGLNNHQQFIQSWYQNGLPENLHILLGAHRKEGVKTYNTFYWIHNHRIIQHYDKKQPLFFTEKVPAIWSWFSCIEKIFLNNSVMFSDGLQDHISCKLSDDCHLSPIICSELFLGKHCNTLQNCTMLALVNDSWFSAVYVQKLMELCALYKAIIWQKDIVYISHTRGLWISKRGRSQKLFILNNHPSC